MSGPWFYEGDHFIGADLDDLAMEDRDTLRLIAMRWRGIVAMLREPERKRFEAQTAQLAENLERAHAALATLIDDADAYREARNRERYAKCLHGEVAPCGDPHCDGHA